MGTSILIPDIYLPIIKYPIVSIVYPDLHSLSSVHHSKDHFIVDCQHCQLVSCVDFGSLCAPQPRGVIHARLRSSAAAASLTTVPSFDAFRFFLNRAFVLSQPMDEPQS